MHILIAIILLLILAHYIGSAYYWAYKTYTHKTHPDIVLRDQKKALKEFEFKERIRKMNEAKRKVD